MSESDRPDDTMGQMGQMNFTLQPDDQLLLLCAAHSVAHASAVPGIPSRRLPRVCTPTSGPMGETIGVSLCLFRGWVWLTAKVIPCLTDSSGVLAQHGIYHCRVEALLDDVGVGRG